MAPYEALALMAMEKGMTAEEFVRVYLDEQWYAERQTDDRTNRSA